MSKQAHINKLIKLTNQMASQHSMLGDRYNKISILFDVLLLVSSALLTFVGFANEQLKEKLFSFLHLSMKASMFMAFMGLIVFLITVLNWQLNWKARAQAHYDAVKSLSQLKREMKRLGKAATATSISKPKYEIAIERYEAVSKHSPNIPERDFLKTKKKHRVKVLVSKMLDTYPGASIFCIKWVIFWRHNKKIWKQ